MPTAFLSHATPDKDFVRQVAADLQANDITVWLDERELLPGARFVDGIAKGLANADYVLLFVSRNFLKSKWAAIESDAALRRAVESRKGSVIPLLLEDVWSFVSPLLQALLYEDFRSSQNILSYRYALGRVLAALNAPSVSLPAITRKPVVMVSGGRLDTGGKKGLAIAGMLGRALVAESIPLVTGSAEGIDTEFANGVADEAAARGLDQRKLLRSYVVKGGTRHHKVGKLLQSRYRNRREGVPELVAESDVAFLLGGSKSTMHLGVLMLLEGKILLPLAITGGAAQDCYSLILSRYERVFDPETLPRSRFEDLSDDSLSTAEIVQNCIDMLLAVTGRQAAT